MNDLDLGELQLAVTELARGERKTAFEQTKASGIYMPSLDAWLVRVEKLPPEVMKLPKVELLKSADGRRDALARAIWHLSQATLVHPDIAGEVELAATVATEHFVPDLSVTRQTYAEASRAAVSNTTDLETHRAALAKLQTPEGKTLADWVTSFAQAGQTLGALHQDRGTEVANSSTRAGAGPLRSEIIGTLNEMRSVIQREVATNLTLARNLEAQIFGYFDELQRLAALRTGQPGTPTPTPTPA